MNTNNTPAEDPIVLPDECGDTLWDAVLQQEVKACTISTPPKTETR